MNKLDIIYEDKEIIVVNKQQGILTISDGKSDHTLYHNVREYLKKQNPRYKVFIVHRLDKDTSGVILFSKSEKLKHYLQDNWNTCCKLREYMAIVENIPLKKKDCLENYLAESKAHQVYITNDKKLGKKSITNYEVVKESKSKSLLRIWIETGRKNQIRVALSNIGCPIVGDKKYGFKSKAQRLELHASKLVIKIFDKEMTFEAKLPKEMSNFD